MTWEPGNNTDHSTRYTLSPKLDEIGIITGTCDEINAITPRRANVDHGVNYMAYLRKNQGHHMRHIINYKTHFLVHSLAVASYRDLSVL